MRRTEIGAGLDDGWIAGVDLLGLVESPVRCGEVAERNRCTGCGDKHRHPAVLRPAALSLLGSLDEARAAAQAGLVLNPTFTLRRFRARAVSGYKAYVAGRERVYEGMRMAGVPEG